MAITAVVLSLVMMLGGPRDCSLVLLGGPAQHGYVLDLKPGHVSVPRLIEDELPSFPSGLGDFALELVGIVGLDEPIRLWSTVILRHEAGIGLLHTDLPSSSSLRKAPTVIALMRGRTSPVRVGVAVTLYVAAAWSRPLMRAAGA
jgi:hypothetical protein